MTDYTGAEKKLLADSQIYDPEKNKNWLFRLSLVVGLLAGGLNVTRGLLGLFGVGQNALEYVVLGLLIAGLAFLMYSYVRDRTTALSLVKKLADRADSSENVAGSA